MAILALYTYSKVITTPDSKRRSRKAPGDECHRYLSKTLSSHLLILILRHLCKSYLLLILPYLDPVLPLFKCDALRTAHARVRNGPGKAWTAFDLSPPTGHSLHSSVRKKRPICGWVMKAFTALGLTVYGTSSDWARGVLEKTCDG